MATTLIRIGKVEEIEGPSYSNQTNGLRIKARLPQDGNLSIENIPWAFPLLPKMFQTAPKYNEAVLIITAEAGNTKSQRFYIGPIIPQPQFMGYASNSKDNDVATSLLQGNSKEPIGRISNYFETHGAFPSHDDVALVGRGQEDLRLKYDSVTQVSEADLTAGIRQKPQNSTNPDIQGNVVFNSKNPAYVQVKHGVKTKEGESFVNIVGEKINLMSHNDEEISEHLIDQDTLVNEESMNVILDKLHPAVKGDKLLELLTLMIGAIKEHVHPWAGMEQCGDWKGYINELNKFNVNSILSNDVKIS